ncbi:50S ribosomal protein L13 [Candidatus Nardonella dryophthoridicola]|uniref:50S ribosomal protein L13 n=1 Tax=Candidatus Nardonella dryophthoridicola TaxID=1971485 RepID=UPI002A4E1EF5|nr:50S ribosomal protein L13 [Candidatus Nardonella dryophthoridicola]
MDAKNEILGRLSSKVSLLLQGKNNINYLPNIDNGDYIIIINSKNIILTGNKKNNKKYYKHTGYIGNLKTIFFKDLINKNPNKIIYNSIKGMLPKNKLFKKIINKKLKIYKDSNHRHNSQKPIKIKI